jgi:hypothetical protein
VTTFYGLLASEFLHSYYHNLDVEFTNTFNKYHTHNTNNNNNNDNKQA